MMRLPAFRHVLARDLDDAAARLAADPAGTKLVAGGTDLLPNLKRRHQHAATIVSLRAVPGLRGRIGDGAAGVRIGAMTTLSAIVRDPVLRKDYPGFVRAVASISSPVLRNMGTLGGNLCLDTRCTYYNQDEEWRRSLGGCLKEAGDTCWVAPSSPRCWAISASDSAPLLVALGASVVLHSTQGTREIPVAALFRDDGIDWLTRRPDEILTEVRLPPVGAWRSTYWKLRRRGSIDFPVLGVGAALRIEEGVVSDARIVLGAVASRPVECDEAAGFLLGRRLDEPTVEAAAALAREPATPMDNTDFTVLWRRKMVAAWTAGALRDLAGLPARTFVPAGGGVDV